MACTCSPGKAICRSCLNPTTKLTPYVGAAVNGKGEFTVHQINTFQEQFERTIVSDTLNNPLTLAVRRYGSETFYSSVNDVNTFLKDPFVIKKLPEYDVLNTRLAIGKITPLEFATFIRDSNYTPSGAILATTAQGPRFLNELDNFYNGDFSDSIMGGFCSLFGNIFAAGAAFFALLDSLEGLMTDVFAFITKIKNIEDPIKAIFEKLKVKALIEAIQKKIGDTIKKTLEKVGAAIANFNPADIMGDIEGFVQRNIVDKIANIKKDIEQFFSKENIDALLTKIETKIRYAIGLFENPSIEEIMFLIARLCGLATGIEGVIKGLKGPLDDFSNRYEEVFDTISNASNRVTGEAIRAGAARLSPEERRKEINKAMVVWEAAGNFIPPRRQEIEQLPTWEALKNGTDERLKIKGRWTTDMFPTHEGWTEIPQDVQVMILRLVYKAREAGITNNYLWLNSGYRNPAWNAGLNPPGAKASMHLSGMAVDLTWNGFRGRSVEVTRFVRLAREVGFTGIGYYNSFIHVDVGRERFWDERS